jgi:hypothetical protein
MIFALGLSMTNVMVLAQRNVVVTSNAPAKSITAGCLVQGKVESPSTDPQCSQKYLPEVTRDPPAPKLEPITIAELPLPPTAPSTEIGACTLSINPHGTGCIAAYDNGIFEGPSYMWDGKHVLLPVEFAGAPEAPAPASVYQGQQIIAVKADGTTFANGDSWKCITCGIPASNRSHAHVSTDYGAGYITEGPSRPLSLPEHLILDHPQAFHDGRRMIAGTNIVDCGAHKLTDDACNGSAIHVYPIEVPDFVNFRPAPIIRELRLHPDDVHLGFSAMIISANRFDQFSVLGALKASDPTESVDASTAYVVDHLNILLDTHQGHPFFTESSTEPGMLVHVTPFAAIGEFRGWSSDGQSLFGNYFEESGNVDIFQTDLVSGKSVRVTRDPAYTDPIKNSPDGNWNAVMDTRQGDRTMWYAGMRGVPPLVDMVGTSVANYAWRIGNRRYFQPYLLDRFGDRGTYYGQQLNDPSTTTANFSDPNWNGRADPTWSPDGTNIVYWQALVTSPACGRDSLPACPNSTESGGRRTRLMIAHLESRRPLASKTVSPAPDAISWALPFHAGDPLPNRQAMAPSGKFKLLGKVSGEASVEIKQDAHGRGISFVSAHYVNYSDDGFHIINGDERVEKLGNGLAASLEWHSNLTESGLTKATKVSSEPQGLIIGPTGHPVKGSMTTTVDGKSYTSPPPGS